MFDHITLRVADLAAASSALTAVLDELEIEQTTSTPSPIHNSTMSQPTAVLLPPVCARRT